MSRPGDELTELLWDNGPALRTAPLFPPAPFQPFTCSAAGSSRAHALDDKRHAASMDGLGGIPIHNDDDDAVPWLHCPVIDDDGGCDSDTAPLPPEYCAGLLSSGCYSAGLHAVPEPDPMPPAGIVALPPPSSNGSAVVVPAATQQPQPSPPSGEGVMNFSFFSRPLQRPQQASAAASPSNNNPLESTVVQTAASRLRNTPLFSEQRMAWFQPPPSRAPRPAAVASPAPHAPPVTDFHRPHAEAAGATVTQQHRLQKPDARAAPDATTSSVCSGNGDRSQTRRSSQQQHTTECSVSQDEDVDDEPGAARIRPAARGTKRSRPAEVHNLSERRRRDRINEKMRALQELIPNCNKIDKASMLEEAIEYLKTLQLQVQMMSMGAGGGGLCGMPPPMLMHPMAAPFPHHHLGLGLGFGMGAAAAFDMLPRFAAAGAQFPCPVMPGGAMPHPHASMFGIPPGQVMPPSSFLHMMNGTSPTAEQMESAAVPAPGGGAGAAVDHPPVAPGAPLQGDPKLT